MGRRRSDHENEVSAHYDVPQTFGPEFKVGSVVLPTFASPVETYGEGKIDFITPDRSWASVLFSGPYILARCEPWDVTLKGDS